MDNTDWLLAAILLGVAVFGGITAYGVVAIYDMVRKIRQEISRH